MEILPFLRLTGRRVVGLTIIGSLAGTAAAFVVNGQARTYQAEAVAFVGQLLPPGSNPFEIGPLVADFQAAIKIEAVQDAAAEATLLTRSEVVVLTERNGADSSSVKVLASGKDDRTAEAIAQEMSLQALKFIANRKVETARVQETADTTKLDKAKQLVEKLRAESKSVNPITDYEQVQQEIIGLRSRASDPGLTLTEPTRQAMLARANALQDTLPQLAARSDTYKTALDSLADSEARLQESNAARQRAEGTLTNAQNSSTISVSNAEPLSPVPNLVRGFGSAMAATFALGIGYFALQDRAKKRPTLTTASTSSGPAAPPRPLVAVASEVAPRSGSPRSSPPPIDEVVPDDISPLVALVEAEAEAAATAESDVSVEELTSETEVVADVAQVVGDEETVDSIEALSTEEILPFTAEIEDDDHLAENEDDRPTTLWERRPSNGQVNATKVGRSRSKRK